MTTHHFVPSVWHKTIGHHAPVLVIASGDTVVTETIDAIGTDKDGISRSTGPNPMNGPIFVEGAEPGDVLRVEIGAMRPIRATGWTNSCLAANVLDPEAVRKLPPATRVMWDIDRNALTVRLQDPPAALADLVLPLEPMIGCFGVAPEHGQAISTATSGNFGGNMDYRRLGPGATVWLPVFATGALFHLGDCHAVQGDGEIVGTGVETCFEVTVTLTVEKARKIHWPRGATGEDIFTIGNARPLDQALQHATTEMLAWLTTEYGLDSTGASHLLGQVVRYDIGNVFDPAYTVACRVAKKWLPATR
jgi:amidase